MSEKKHDHSHRYHGEPHRPRELHEQDDDTMSDSQDSDRESARDASSGTLSWAKKLMTVGIGTYFLTEETLKTLVSEFKLPKEIVSGILDGAKNVRKEFMQNVVSEMMGRISDRLDPSAVLAEFLKKNEVTFEVKVKVKDAEKKD